VKSIEDLLLDLSHLDIKLWVDEQSRLRCNAPSGTLIPEIRTQLSERKAEIIDFLQQVNLNSNSSFESISPVLRDKDLPLSFAQEGLWFLYQLNNKGSNYNMPCALQITGSLNVVVLEQALTEIVRRHEILRTNFQQVEAKTVQVINPDTTFKLKVIDLEGEQLVNVQNFINLEVEKPFDLHQDALFQTILWRLNDQSYVLLLNMHHIISDGWSTGILLQELSTLYQAYLSENKSPLPELPIQYADFALWQRQYLSQEVRQKQLNYWQQQLADAPPLLQLPTDRVRPPVQSFRGGIKEFQINADVSKRIRALSQESKATLFMTMLAAFVTLLYRYSNQDDILVGSPMANRNRREIEPLIGYFVNTVVLRTQLVGNLSFWEVLNRVRTVAMDAHAHQDVPFEQVVEALQPQRNLSHSPLFQVLFDLQHSLTEKLLFPGLALTPFGLEHTTSKFDLSLVIEDTGDKLIGWWEYSSDLFSLETITRLSDNFQILLAGIVANPETPINELPLLSAAEQQQILVEWNDTFIEYPDSKCIHQLFEEQVARTPQDIAVVFEEEEFTYQQLNSWANKIAHYLQSLGVRPEVLVAICLERSLEMVIGLLAVLKAGGAYLPLDPNYPSLRLAHMLDDSQVSVLLTRETLREFLPENGAKVVCLDTDFEDIYSQSEDNPVSGVKPENLAYVIYTSGSTGKPKGVMIPHQGVVNHSQAMIAEYSLTCDDRVLQFASFSFDVAIEELFPTLLSGATLVMRPAQMFVSFTDFTKFILEQRLTVANLPTPYWQEWVLELSQGKATVPNCLRLVVTGSEQVLPERLALWQQLVGDRVMWINAYGPTEATITATVYQLAPTSESSYINSVSIGRPIANTQIYILDKNLQPVPIGVPGELHIGGLGLAERYLNHPDLTAQKFIPNPFTHFGLPKLERLYKTGDQARYLPDGNIEFLGRIDNQVKIRGFRIELGEIEAVLAQHPEVRASAVIARVDQPGNKQLVAYIVPNDQSQIQNQLRGFLKQKLPDYMVPSFFVMLEELPLTPNGKVDRHALPSPSVINNSNKFVSPSTCTEINVSDIWNDVLGIQQVGIHDNFFELGGHSLRASQVMSRLREAFQVELPLRYLFEEPTIAGLAELIDTIIHTGTSAKLTTNTEENFRKDAVLDSTIQPPIPFEYVSQPKSIFLTGATGFVGAYLLHELLEQTQADIYCLIRSSNLEQATQKLQNKLESYGLWNVTKNNRIIPVVGDLSKKLLGLSPSQFHDLASQIDVIYHNGAWINTIYPYSVLKPSNVLGTQEILRLASEIKLKPVHYISTTSVFSAQAYSQTKLVPESDPLENTEGLEGGYCQSKWVAEKLVMQARDRGLPVAIYRLARVTGHSQIGVCNTDDLFCRLIKGCIQMGIAPKMDGVVDNLTPVDFVSRAIVHLSYQKASLGKAFHLLNPHPTPMNDLFNWIRALGYPLEIVAYEKWLLQLVAQSKVRSNNVLQPLVPLYSQQTMESTPEPKLDWENTCQGLAGTDIVFPTIDKKLLHIYFSYLTSSGFLPALSTRQVSGTN
jgi:amino acid adenylation domain-containing protein/thioester reductase-like protein